MTTIAYRDGVMAADSRAYSGGKTPIGSKVKVHRLPDGSLFGVSSANVGADALVRRWLEAGCPIPSPSDLKPESFTLLVVRSDGEVFYASDNLELTGPLTASFFAIGSGEKFAQARWRTAPQRSRRLKPPAPSTPGRAAR